jgi:hypothetical protein
MSSSAYILPIDTDSEIDVAIIPNEMYDITINRQKLKIQEYFISHPKLMFSFVGFNSALKLANQLASDKKCKCNYLIPWITKYQVDNNTRDVKLTFSQQVAEYRYMILNWYPSPSISNMRYLSNIALGIIQDLGVYRYYLGNNLQTCSLSNKPYIRNIFGDDNRKLYVYVLNIFSNNYNSYNNNV